MFNGTHVICSAELLVKVIISLPNIWSQLIWLTIFVKISTNFMVDWICHSHIVCGFSSNLFHQEQTAKTWYYFKSFNQQLLSLYHCQSWSYHTAYMEKWIYWTGWIEQFWITSYFNVSVICEWGIKLKANYKSKLWKQIIKIWRFLFMMPINIDIGLKGTCENKTVKWYGNSYYLPGNNRCLFVDVFVYLSAKLTWRQYQGEGEA